MRHYHITRVLYVSMIGFLITAGLVTYLYSQVPTVSAAPVFVPFGGFVDSVVANLDPAGALICPVFSLITNVDTTNGLPPEFGVYIPPDFPMPTYDYNNIYTLGTRLMGGVETVPCPASVPVFPLFFDAPDGPFYLTGTGLF